MTTQAEHHAAAKRRTPSSQYDASEPVCASWNDEGFTNLDDALSNLLDRYEDEHGHLPPEDWQPEDAYLHGTSRVECPLEADDWAAVMIERLEEDCDVATAQGVADDAMYLAASYAYPDWADNNGDEFAEEVAALLPPAIAYLERYGQFADRAELARLLGPAVEAARTYNYGYTEDLSHAIDLEPAHLAAFVQKEKQAREKMYARWAAYEAEREGKKP